MLKAAELPLPRKVAVHGFWTTDGAKMSKSVGNVVDPLAYKEKYGLDAVRHFLLGEISFGVDGDFSQRRFVVRDNTGPAHILRNLAHRTVSMEVTYIRCQDPPPAPN